jgi:hypothetical protein
MAVKSIKADSEKTRPSRVRYATYLPPDITDIIRRAAFHLHLTTGEVVENAIVEYIAKVEKKLGKPFSPIPGLRPGKPIRGERSS